jgi:hypothetical protein
MGELCKVRGSSAERRRLKMYAGFQAVTSNPSTSDLFPCKWLRAPDVNPRVDDSVGVGTVPILRRVEKLNAGRRAV